jgi:hypothetical protein
MTSTGPLWTHARLMRVMLLRFGASPRGHVNVHAAGQAMGVSPRTVQRWLAGSSGRALAHIPHTRLEQLIALLMPSQETLRDEAQTAAYARKAIKQLRLPRDRGVLPSWKVRRWTEPHLVVVLAIKDAGIRQLAVTRAGAKSHDELAKRGKIIDFEVVPSRFHATVLVHEVLTELGPWRFQAHLGDVKQGRTQAWLDDAPATSLAAATTKAGL